MTVEELISQCELRLEYLKSSRVSNIQLGNNDIVNKIDIDILETENTIIKLKNK